MRRIIIDTDPGVDDSMAILLAFRSPELKVEALTTMLGNGGTDVTTTNALRLVEVAGHPEVPVARGADAPLLRPYRGEGWRVHGRNGLGQVEFPHPTTPLDPRRAAQLIIDMVLANPGEITLVPLAPMTNIALAAMIEPRIIPLVKEVVLMGGAADVPGNASPTSEANIRNDPDAAWVVFHAGWPITMFGLDVTMKTVMSRAYLDAIGAADNPQARFIHAIVQHYLGVYAARGLDGIPTHDPSAIAYLIDPTLFTQRPAYVDVDRTSEHYFGNTVPDWRGQRGQPPNANVAVAVDSPRLLAMYAERLGVRG